jgi:hypothetical protein
MSSLMLSVALGNTLIGLIASCSTNENTDDKVCDFMKDLLKDVDTRER